MRSIEAYRLPDQPCPHCRSRLFTCPERPVIVNLAASGNVGTPFLAVIGYVL